jgi:hypothetical protein
LVARLKSSGTFSPDPSSLPLHGQLTTSEAGGLTTTVNHGFREGDTTVVVFYMMFHAFQKVWSYKRPCGK